MSRQITRRTLLRGGARGALALAASECLRAPALALAQGAAQTSAQASDAARHARAYQLLDAYVARHMQEVGAPGLTLVLTDRTRTLRVSTYGLADLKTGARVRPETLFQIGSISKSFVAIALLQLRDEGKLDLQRPVADYLPWLKLTSTGAPVTTHHLLSHTAGLAAAPLLMRVVTGQLRTGYAPGAHFVYSNLGYLVLGLLLERLDGRPFADALKRRVLDPLGMSASAPVISNEVRERQAVGYVPFYDDRPYARRGPLAEAGWTEFTEAAGSIVATPADMGAYLRLLLNGGATPRGTLISTEGFRLLTTAVIRAPFRGEEASYAYGLWVSETGGRTLLRHTGGMVAFSSAMCADLTTGLGAFASVNANLEGYRPTAVVAYALDLLRASAADEELPAAPAAPPAPDVVRNAADYAGTFTSATGRKLVLVAEGERLLLDASGARVALEPAGRDLFIVKHPEFARFLLGFGREQNRVVEAFHGADWYTNAAYTGAREFSYPKEWEAYAGHYRNDSPWYGSMRVVLRKGRLWVDGVQPLVPLAGGLFRPGDEEYLPDRMSFGDLLDGRAMRLDLSGIEFYRAQTP